jgi:hypothetical protein
VMATDATPATSNRQGGGERARDLICTRLFV